MGCASASWRCRRTIRCAAATDARLLGSAGLPRRVRFPDGPIRPAGGDDRLALWLLTPSHAGDMAADRPLGTRHSRGRGVGWACRCGGVPSTALGAAKEAAGHGERGSHRSVPSFPRQSSPGSAPGTRILGRLCGPRPSIRSRPHYSISTADLHLRDARASLSKAEHRPCHRPWQPTTRYDPDRRPQPLVLGSGLPDQRRVHARLGQRHAQRGPLDNEGQRPIRRQRPHPVGLAADALATRAALRHQHRPGRRRLGRVLGVEVVPPALQAGGLLTVGELHPPLVGLPGAAIPPAPASAASGPARTRRPRQRHDGWPARSRTRCRRPSRSGWPRPGPPFAPPAAAAAPRPRSCPPAAPATSAAGPAAEVGLARGTAARRTLARRLPRGRRHLDPARSPTAVGPRASRPACPSAKTATPQRRCTGRQRPSAPPTGPGTPGAPGRRNAPPPA
jgi:hypothetical protein